MFIGKRIVFFAICAFANSSACVCATLGAEPHVRTSIDALDQGTRVSITSANYALRCSTIEEALNHSRKAVQAHPDDMESHQSLAEALEEKLATAHGTDPYLLQECVQEWLIVLRSEVGEEKGMGFRGINLMGHLYEDENYAIHARQHLIRIVGHAPKPWETDSHYLKGALRTLTVEGKIVRSK